VISVVRTPPGFFFVLLRLASEEQTWAASPEIFFAFQHDSKCSIAKQRASLPAGGTMVRRSNCLLSLVLTSLTYHGLSFVIRPSRCTKNPPICRAKYEEDDDRERQEQQFLQSSLIRRQQELMSQQKLIQQRWRSSKCQSGIGIVVMNVRTPCHGHSPGWIAPYSLDEKLLSCHTNTLYLSNTIDDNHILSS